MSECGISRELEDGCPVLRIVGVFDRPAAWSLRARVEQETGRELILDFSLVREFSDLAVAVLAHGLQARTLRVRVRGMRQHQLRIFRYCGHPLDEVPLDAPLVSTGPAPKPA
jgi:anti-anti-sigma regulatory factor